MVQTGVVIRVAMRQDVAAIVALWEELMDFHRVKDPFFERAPSGSNVFARFVEESIRNDAACVLVAVVEGRIVGYCQGILERHPPVIAEPEHGQILDFAVTASHQGAGVGTQMFEALCEWFRREGVRRLEVRHSTCNETAARFWPRMGFKPYLKTLFKEL
jgi:GNAT superfamily N-acetyltransferase